MTGGLAIIGTPIQWVVLAAIVVVVFAPQLVPVIARILGRLFGREVQRRYGITLRAKAPRRRVEPVAEPDRESYIETAAASEPNTRTPTQEPLAHPHRPSALPVWAGSAVAAGAAAVLLWYLLHAR